jgi:hypothetical protein
MKPATTGDHRRFCEVDGWMRTADTPGRHVSNHEVWTRRLSDGAVLRTSISKGQRQYGQQLFSRILTHQLQVTADQFWTAVDTGIRPRRPGDQAPTPEEPRIPLWMFMRLKRELGYSDADILEMGPTEAERRYRAWEKQEPESAD